MSASGAPSAGGTAAVAVDPLDLESQICFALSVASRSVVAAYRPVLEPLGLTHPQYLVMLALWQHAPLSGRELSRLLRLDPGTLSPLLKRLDTQGLVTRRRRVDDERALAIELTPAGVALRREAESIPGRMMARLGVQHDELVVLHRTMTALIVAADAEGEGDADAEAEGD
ncbi:MarR family transcriptional regulator [Frigoribacterium sp. VKM Ac-2836]|uniref:MarR family winged helix-turn-helix transcriptional regulator n=1 Tax=Frigoribacterium sp. VKM Ac-2836 TaxID=2739014 RepID=UPI001564C24F|nr:MarR family transcriptional regulator [Frigoribacterium sp. VKM Ac-2836]